MEEAIKRADEVGWRRDLYTSYRLNEQHTVCIEPAQLLAVPSSGASPRDRAMSQCSRPGSEPSECAETVVSSVKADQRLLRQVLVMGASRPADAEQRPRVLSPGSNAESFTYYDAVRPRLPTVMHGGLRPRVDTSASSITMRSTPNFLDAPHAPPDIGPCATHLAPRSSSTTLPEDSGVYSEAAKSSLSTRSAVDQTKRSARSAVSFASQPPGHRPQDPLAGSLLEQPGHATSESPALSNKVGSITGLQRIRKASAFPDTAALMSAEDEDVPPSALTSSMLGLVRVRKASVNDYGPQPTIVDHVHQPTTSVIHHPKPMRAPSIPEEQEEEEEEQDADDESGIEQGQPAAMAHLKPIGWYRKKKERKKKKKKEKEGPKRTNKEKENKRKEANRFNR